MGERVLFSCFCSRFCSRFVSRFVGKRKSITSSAIASYKVLSVKPEVANAHAVWLSSTFSYSPSFGIAAAANSAISCAEGSSFAATAAAATAQLSLASAFGPSSEMVGVSVARAACQTGSNGSPRIEATAKECTTSAFTAAPREDIAGALSAQIELKSFLLRRIHDTSFLGASRTSWAKRVQKRPSCVSSKPPAEGFAVTKSVWRAKSALSVGAVGSAVGSEALAASRASAASWMALARASAARSSAPSTTVGFFAGFLGRAVALLGGGASGSSLPLPLPPVLRRQRGVLSSGGAGAAHTTPSNDASTTSRPRGAMRTVVWFAGLVMKPMCAFCVVFPPGGIVVRPKV